MSISVTLCFRQLTKIFLHIDNRITFLKFLGEPCGSYDLGEGIAIPVFTSIGYFPVLAMLLSVEVMPSCMSCELQFRRSALILSHIAHFKTTH